jgi:hypothetical protein
MRIPTTSIKNSPMEDFINEVRALGRLSIGDCDAWLEKKIQHCGIERVKHTLAALQTIQHDRDSSHQTNGDHLHNHFAKMSYRSKFLYFFSNAWHRATHIIIRAFLNRDGVKLPTELDHIRLNDIFAEPDLHPWLSATRHSMGIKIRDVSLLFQENKLSKSFWLEFSASLFFYVQKESGDFLKQMSREYGLLESS